MGRDVASLRIDKKPNVKSNGVTLERVHVAPRVSKEKVETKEQEVEDHNPKGTADEESQGKLDVLGIKSTNSEAGAPGGKTTAEALKPCEKKLNSPVKPALETVANSPALRSPELLTGKHASRSSNIGGIENSASSPPSRTSDMDSPLTAKNRQAHSPLVSRKPLQPDSNKKYHDEEDNCSLASSTATSVRSSRFKVTVPVAPTFKSAERVARRKEFCMKLEEKHKALEAEKLEYAARTKEEEEAAIKQLRKTMIYKANPVPSFYHEGPPPKVELKKLPVTRAKSPNLTRRKSCSDAVKTPTDDKKICARATRHSTGVYSDRFASTSTPKNKVLSSTRNVSGPNKFKDSNGASKPKAQPKQVKQTAKAVNGRSEQTSTDIRVLAETTTSCGTVEQRA